jgi:hypothetical protein
LIGIISRPNSQRWTVRLAQGCTTPRGLLSVGVGFLHPAWQIAIIRKYPAVAAEPSLRWRYQRRAAGRASRSEESRRHRGAQRLRQPAVVKARGMAERQHFETLIA